MTTVHTVNTFCFSQKGPLWRMVRGKGIAYGCNITVETDSELLMFEIYRSSHPIQCFNESKEVVESLLGAQDDIDEDDFEAAKRSLMFEVINAQATVHDASYQNLLTYYRGVDRTYHKYCSGLSKRNTVIFLCVTNF